jgi:hypothetical protein
VSILGPIQTGCGQVGNRGINCSEELRLRNVGDVASIQGELEQLELGEYEKGSEQY